MTAETLHRQWEILIDKYESRYFEDFEFNTIANQAQLDVVTYIFYNRFEKAANPYRKDAHLGEPKDGWENTQIESYDLSPLTKAINLTSTNGQINITDIETQLSGTLFHIGQVGVAYTGGYKNARWVRHNDYERLEENYFKKASQNSPIYRMFDNYILVEPTGNINVRMTVLRYPTEILYDSNNPSNNVDPELSDRVMQLVLKEMLKISGVAIRDNDLFTGGKALMQGE